MRPLLRSPLLLAAVVALANAVKPVTVDDTAYLTYARHIAANPADPYGFTVFWWAEPEPAMGVLCPPVVPYWLAAGISLFGESVPLLKLWLFPPVYLLAWALHSLLVRFARGTEGYALPLLILSPAVLPTVNVMLDIPAVALALAAVEVFARACDSRRWRLAVLAGLVAALAMQAKYSAFVAPAVVAWYGLTHRHLGRAAVACGVCVAAFAGWELWLVHTYGRSHFWHHASGAGGEGGLIERIQDKLALVPPLASYLGCLAVGPGLLAASALRVPRRWLIGTAVAWCVCFALVTVLPKRWLATGDDVTAGTLFWHVAGFVWLAAALACAAVLLVRVRKGLSFRMNTESVFVGGWLLLELGAALALTPFPAARRVIGLTLVMGIVAARGASRVSRLRPLTAPRWALAVGVAAGGAVAATDTLDAFPEKWCAERAAEAVVARPPTSTVWYVGHWGFQYYCERVGMRPFVPGLAHPRPGDYVVLPVYPDGGFHRPHAGFGFTEPAGAELVAEVVWDDALSAQTVPNFYGGQDPLTGRDHPRLRVRVYRVLSAKVLSAE
jgi:hypothetical protein